MRPTKYLSIYLNDHLAALTALAAVARRSARSNRGTDLGRYLEEVAEEISDANRRMADLAGDAGVRRDPFKRGAAWAAEKLGRLKLNGHLFRYSPLSRVLELEGLMAGAELERATWGALAQATGRDLADLAERCERRRERLAEQHAGAIQAALGRGTTSPTR